jgi:hypothetical protein
MREMKIKVKDEIKEEFQKFILHLLTELPARNIRCVTNESLFLLPLPDDIDANLIKQRIIQRYGSKAKITIVEKD